MKCLPFIFVILLKVSFISCQQRLDLDPVREWKLLDFDFPSSHVREDAIRKGLFVQQNAAPIDVDVDYQGTVSNHISITRHLKLISHFISIGRQIKNICYNSTICQWCPSDTWIRSIAKDRYFNQTIS